MEHEVCGDSNKEEKSEDLASRVSSKLKQNNKETRSLGKDNGAKISAVQMLGLNIGTVSYTHLTLPTMAVV